MFINLQMSCEILNVMLQTLFVKNRVVLLHKVRIICFIGYKKLDNTFISF